ncbi:unnamed protein product [Vicia faba]|uniref:Uncharacterized protein n=1 Tax=Vicia faba TaxID=3906 RepID=A0AAV1AZP7_VICFA|nr:unnamed protein product [Vicia faba]
MKMLRVVKLYAERNGIIDEDATCCEFVCTERWSTGYAHPVYSFNYSDDMQNYRQRFIRAWGIIKKNDSKTLGRRNSIPLEPYLKWVRARAQSLMMSYDSILQVILEPVVQVGESRIILHPDMPTNFKELQKSWIQLKEERDTFEAQLYASEKKVLELTKQLHEEMNLNTYLNTKRKRPWGT